MQTRTYEDGVKDSIAILKDTQQDYEQMSAQHANQLQSCPDLITKRISQRDLSLYTEKAQLLGGQISLLQNLIQG